MKCTSSGRPVMLQSSISIVYRDETWNFCNKVCRDDFIEHLPKKTQMELTRKKPCCSSPDPVETSSSLVCRNCGLDYEVTWYDTEPEFKRRERISTKEFGSDDFRIPSKTDKDWKYD